MNIYLNDISKSFGKKKVILPLSLTFESGKFTTLLGSSGCGKTTLLRMIAGLEIPDTGEIKFDDTIVFSKDRGINLPPEKRNLSFVFQDFALWPHMTVFENVAFGLKARKNKENLKEKVQAALDIVKLGDLSGRYPHELSGGPTAESFVCQSYRGRTEMYFIRRTAFGVGRTAARRDAGRNKTAYAKIKDDFDIRHARPSRSDEHERLYRRHERRRSRTV